MNGPVGVPTVRRAQHARPARNQASAAFSAIMVTGAMGVAEGFVGSQPKRSGAMDSRRGRDGHRALTNSARIGAPSARVKARVEDCGGNVAAARLQLRVRWQKLGPRHSVWRGNRAASARVAIRPRAWRCWRWRPAHRPRPQVVGPITAVPPIDAADMTTPPVWGAGCTTGHGQRRKPVQRSPNRSQRQRPGACIDVGRLMSRRLERSEDAKLAPGAQSPIGPRRRSAIVRRDLQLAEGLGVRGR